MMSEGTGTYRTYRPEVTPHATEGITVAQKKAQPNDSENNRETQTVVTEVTPVSAMKSPQQGRNRIEVMPMTKVAAIVRTINSTARSMSGNVPRISYPIYTPVPFL